MALSILARTTRKMELPSTDMRKPACGTGFGGESQEFGLGQVRFKILIHIQVQISDRYMTAGDRSDLEIHIWKNF